MGHTRNGDHGDPLPVVVCLDHDVGRWPGRAAFVDGQRPFFTFGVISSIRTLFWIASVEAAGRKRTTVDSYSSHLDLHIVPFIGDLKLIALNIAAARSFEDQLRAAVVLKR